MAFSDKEEKLKGSKLLQNTSTSRLRYEGFCSENSMESLNSDIIYTILSDHVPASSVLNCKLVCKTWKTLLSGYKVGLIFLVALRGETDAQLYYGYYEEVMNDQGQFSHEVLTKINLPPIQMVEDEQPMIVGSCNGLVCISVPENDNPFIYDPVYICNPTPGECINLPKLSQEHCHIVSGFGYLPKTNEYEVVRIYYSYANPSGKVQVYTLGNCGGGWRNIKVKDIPIQFYNVPRVAGNGVIYFMDTLKWRVVTFDLADENFRLP
ncbi:F-box protein At3g07870-like [Papaver somniferum]|uniref:F-box protein At3g07870-like n=1 Tax=Papaver somniferum TaxID=3469 RepID=UPI000E700B3C|nr:F-box protein At3g07870-like [Papaver somniferum]